MTKIIEILVSPTGQATVQTKGSSGASSKDASRFIEQALGQVIAEQRTAEFYQPQASTQQQQQGT